MTALEIGAGHGRHTIWIKTFFKNIEEAEPEEAEEAEEAEPGGSEESGEPG